MLMNYQARLFSTRDLSVLENRNPLTGNCNGKFTFVSVDASFLQSLLPPSIILAQQKYTPPGQHPLLLMFNDTYLQSNDFLKSIARQYNIPLKLHYNEFIVMIPFVKFRDEALNESTAYCFLPVLYLDSLLAVIGGRIFWEFNKNMAVFDVTNTTYLVSSEELRQPYFYSEFILGKDRLPSRDVKNFVSITPILELPVIEYGSYGYVSSIYKIEYEDAYIIPISSTTENRFCRYLPNTTLQVPDILVNELGGFIMNYTWSLSYIKFVRF
jgi:hypothetical protein